MDYEKLRDTRNSTNPYAKRMGIFVEEIGPGCARAVMDVTPDDGYYAVTISATYNFVRSAKLGDRLIAEARETKSGRNVSFFDVEVRDQNGTLLGSGSFSYYRLDKEIVL